MSDLKSIKRIEFEVDEFERIETNIAAVNLRRNDNRKLVHHHISGLSEELLDDGALSYLARAIAIQANSDHRIIPALMQLSRHGLTLGRCVAALKLEAAGRADELSNSNCNVTHNDHPAPQFTAKFEGLHLPEGADVPFQLIVQHLAIGLSHIAASLEVSPRLFFTMLRLDTVEAEAAGLTLMDLAAQTATATKQHPLFYLKEFDHDDRCSRYVSGLTLPAAGLRPYAGLSPNAKSVENLLKKSVIKLIKSGVIPDLTRLPLLNLTRPVLRADKSFVLAIDLLVIAHRARLSLDKLADALTAVFAAKIALMSDDGANHVGNGQPQSLPKVDADLAAFIICTIWPAKHWHFYVDVLRNLNRKGVTLLDLCAHSIIAETLIYKTRQDTPHPNPMTRIEATFEFDPLPSATAGAGFAVLAGALDGTWNTDDFARRLKNNLLDLDDDGFFAEFTECESANDVEIFLADLMGIMEASGACATTDLTAMAAGLALGFARFKAEDPDETMFVGDAEPHLSITELACRELLSLTKHINQFGAAKLHLNKEERAIHEAAKVAASKMLGVLSGDIELYARFKRILNSSDINVSDKATL